MSSSESELAKHQSILAALGLTDGRQDSRCTAYSASKRRCRKKACAYRPAGYLQEALCYDPSTEVPGYIWGTWRKPSESIYDKAVGLIAQRLKELEPFPGSGYDRLQALRTQQEPEPLSAEERAVIESMKKRATQVFNSLLQTQAFDIADVTMITLDSSGKQVAVDLIPGDHIYRSGAFGIQAAQHHGIYIGQGLVIEVGGGGIPAVSGLGQTLCALNLRKSPAKGVVGLSRLDQFNLPHNETVKIDYRAEDRLSRAETIRNAIQLLGRWNYKLQNSNCEHFATFVATGKWRSAQVDKAYKAADYYVVKPLRHATKWIWQSRARNPRIVTNCRLFEFNVEPTSAACSVKFAKDHRPSSAMRRRHNYVQFECGDRVLSCHRIGELSNTLRNQKRLAEPFHDPETGYYLSGRQVKLIHKAAERR